MRSDEGKTLEALRTGVEAARKARSARTASESAAASRPSSDGGAVLAHCEKEDRVDGLPRAAPKAACRAPRRAPGSRLTSQSFREYRAPAPAAGESGRRRRCERPVTGPGSGKNLLAARFAGSFSSPSLPSRSPGSPHELLAVCFARVFLRASLLTSVVSAVRSLPVARLVSFIAVLSLLASSPGLVRAAATEGTIEWIEVPAPALEGNLLGTSASQRTAMYLPPSYRDSVGRRYPVVYLLHGIFDTPDVWVKLWKLPAMLDRLIGDRSIEEMIVVMPTGRNDLGGGFYLDSSVSGGWGDFIRRDLVDFVDSKYRTIADRRARAIAGHSMGGFGAIWHAMTSADVFGVAYAMSPALLSVEDDVSHGNWAAWRQMIEMGGFAGAAAALERRDFWPVAVLSVCTSFLPDPEDEAFLCDVPYRLEREELVPVEPALDRWRRRLPLHVADEHVDALRSMTAIALEYGIDDQFAHIPETTQQMSDVLSDLRVPHALFVYRGDHRNRLAERLESDLLPWLSRHLTVESGRDAR